MNAIIKSEMISRRKALSLMGLTAAFGLAAAPTVLTVSDAEAQTVGMNRRQERRAARHERRQDAAHSTHRAASGAAHRYQYRPRYNYRRSQVIPLAGRRH